MTDLPKALVAAIVALITVLFAANVIADIFVAGYSGYPTTMLLAGLVGGALGIDRMLRKGGGDQ